MLLFLKWTLRWIAIANLAGLLLIVLWQVISRHLLADPSTGSEELARILLMWLGMLGGACAAGEKAHMAIDFLSQSLAAGAKNRLRRILALFTALFALFFLLGGLRMIQIVTRLDQTTPVLGIPVGLVYLAAPLSALFVLVFAYFEFIGESSET